MLKALPERFPLTLFIIYSGILLLSVFGAIIFKENILILIPFIALFGFVLFADYTKVYYFLFALMPLSIEIMINDNIATNLPTEPVMLALTFVAFLILAKDYRTFDRQFFTHPIIWMLGIHLIWIMVSLIYTENLIVSLKYFLAKIWFVGVFVLLTSRIITNRKKFMPAFWCIIIPLIAVTIYILTRHSFSGFAFNTINQSVGPFFRNHVNYAALLTIILPFALMALNWYKKHTKQRNFILFAIMILVLGIIFSYTRAAWVALVVGIAVYYAVQLKLLKYIVGALFIGSFVFIGYMANNNKYLDFAPDFERTIYHGELGEHLEATLALQDVSSAERFYRWVAAFHMFQEKPLTGYGPGNFYPYYKQHTVLSFQTYVSDNPEKSTVHNYYLLMLVEQGLIGFIIFLLLVIIVLYYAERIYHQTKKKKQRQYIMALIVSTCIIMVHILVSDLIEVDKIGSFFFLNLTLLVNQDILNKKKEGKLLEPTA